MRIARRPASTHAAGSIESHTLPSSPLSARSAIWSPPCPSGLDPAVAEPGHRSRCVRHSVGYGHGSVPPQLGIWSASMSSQPLSTSLMSRAMRFWSDLAERRLRRLGADELVHVAERALEHRRSASACRTDGGPRDGAACRSAGLVVEDGVHAIEDRLGAVAVRGVPVARYAASRPRMAAEWASSVSSVLVVAPFCTSQPANAWPSARRQLFMRSCASALISA